MSHPSFNAPLRYPTALRLDQNIALALHHVRALQARGVQVKEAFSIIDVDDRYFRASLKGMDARGGNALVYEEMAGATESPVDITLLCAVLGRQRMLSVLQKATELGVSRIVPLLSEYSVQREGLDHEKSHAWPNQVLRAARQCRRASLPEVLDAVPVAYALEASYFRDARLCVYLDDRADNLTMEDVPVVGPPNRAIVFLVGPEGGWSDGERALFMAKGARPLRLGGRVLRAETAMLAGLALLQHVYGDM